MYDVSRNLMFENSIKYASEGSHGDQIEIVNEEGVLFAEAWNDGYPNGMGGGGMGRQIPDSLFEDFSIKKLDEWLTKTFWASGNISNYRVSSDEEVIQFIKENYNRNKQRQYEE